MKAASGVKPSPLISLEAPTNIKIIEKRGLGIWIYMYGYVDVFECVKHCKRGVEAATQDCASAVTVKLLGLCDPAKMQRSLITLALILYKAGITLEWLSTLTAGHAASQGLGQG